MIKQPVPVRSWFISGAATYPTALPRFENTTPIREFVESGSRNVRYTTPGIPGVDVGVGVQLMRRLFVGGAVSAFSGSSVGDVNAEIPHPFFFDERRELTASVGGLERQELGVHIQAATILPIGRRFRLLVAGGPSFFRVRQELVTDALYSQEYPFDTVAFTSARTEAQAKTAFGFHGQASLVAMLSRRVGADMLVRYSTAKALFDSPDGSTFSASLGGMQVGLGLRAMF